MKGLLLKDLALVKAQMRSAIIIFAVVIFMLVAGQDTGFIIMYANIIFMMFGLSTISYDAFDNGEAFLFTLPITKKLYVKEKYVFSLGALLFGFALSLVLLLTIKGSGASEISFSVGYMLGGMIFLSIMLPIELKFGPEKARLAMIAAMIIIASSVYAIIGVAKKLNMEDYFGELAHLGVPSILIFLGIVSSVIIFISYKISCRIMEKKEF